MPAPRQFANPDTLQLAPIVALRLPNGPPTPTRRRFKQHDLPKARVSDATRERLYQEALAYPGCEGMAPGEVKAWVDSRINVVLPFWHGHTSTADTAARKARREFNVRHGLPL